jgi:hypothetical protein
MKNVNHLVVATETHLERADVGGSWCYFLAKTGGEATHIHAMSVYEDGF